MSIEIVYIIIGIAVTVSTASFGIGFTLGGKFQTKEKCELLRAAEQEKMKESFRRAHERIDDALELIVSNN